MREEVVKGYVKAGEIAKKVRSEAISSILKGERDVERLCERIERKIRELGAEPAFPLNVGINEVAAHYSPYPGDEISIPEDGVVKVDLGVKLGDYIVDTAATVDLSGKHEDLVECTREALRRAVERVMHGVKASDIGWEVEKTARSRGFKPIENLSGHLIKGGVLHAGKSIPNVKTLFSDRLEEGEVLSLIHI